jgi:hypothetical protein
MIMTNTLNNFSMNDIIFTENNIYKTQNGLNNIQELYILEYNYHKLNWEKCNHDLSNIQVKLENSNDIYYLITNDYTYIYKIVKKNDNYILNQVIEYNKNNYLTKLMNESMDISIDMNSQEWSLIKKCSEINFHINLMNEDKDCIENKYPYDILDDEPLCGWENKFDIDIIDDYNIINDNDSVNESLDTNLKETLETNLETKLTETLDEDIKKDIDEDIKKDLVEEYRFDPYDNESYSKSEFLEYYGGLNEWNHQDQGKILLREQYYKFTDTFSYLDYDKFVYLFEKFSDIF